jgi:signal transduction histidine kinase
MAGFYEQIQRADRLAAVGTLATGIAHEIRNPLASIRGMVQLLAEAGPEGVGSSTEYTTRILREVDRLEKLISGIMDFANKEGSPPEEVDINALLTEVVESARLNGGGAHLGAGLVASESDPPSGANPSGTPESDGERLPTLREQGAEGADPYPDNPPRGEPTTAHHHLSLEPRRSP